MAVPMTPPPHTQAFLHTAGWANAAVVPLAGDASFRRYFRVIEGARQAVLMDAPPPHEDPRPFIDIAAYLRDNGFAAPQVLASDLDVGLVLIEDFGDARLRETLDAEPHRELELYTQAIVLLAALQAKPVAPLPPYSVAELHRETEIFVDWYCPAVGLDVDRAGYTSAWARTFERMGDARAVTVLRDYHAENIMLRDGEEGLGFLGLLDFQDALVGHPAYDLVSLLQDARRDVSEELEGFGLARYHALASADKTFDAAYHVLGAQRNAKILGIFARLRRRDGKSRYLSMLPRVWGYLERDLAHPALAEVAGWFDTNVPPSLRAARWQGV